MKFDTDKYKNDRLMLIERLTKKIRQLEIPFDGELFHTIVYVYTESQQWQDVSNILRTQQTNNQCKPM